MAVPKPPYLGVAYYPEAWPVSQINEDIALMKERGISCVRVAEFAWARLEPAEGEYTMAWLHLVVQKMADAGLAVVMCTPTCTPPEWLAHRYPEVLTVNDRGEPARHGARRHACPNNTVYRDYCEKIVTRMAEEFGHYDHIIGWQVDNELYPGSPHDKDDRGCCCPVCNAAFRAWLKRRFGTIDELNKTWCLDLWSQRYTSFDRISHPRRDTWHHPSLLTAWMEFQSDSYADFAGLQASLLHRLTKHPVGTDMMPFNGLSYSRMHRNLDLAQHNHYHDETNLWKAGFWFDFIRPLKSVPFWNTETSVSWPGSVAAQHVRPPGFCRVNSWLPVIMGGEANMYWLWRTHPAGQELMMSGVVTTQGRPSDVDDEVRDVASGFSRCAGFLNGTRPAASGLGIHFSHLAWWMFHFQPVAPGFVYERRMEEGVYQPLVKAQLRPDIIDPSADLDAYRIIFSPFLPSLEEGGLVRRLKLWIERGGIWIAGPLTDIRTVHGTKYVRGPFGQIEAWADIYTARQVPAPESGCSLKYSDGNVSGGSVWNDGFTADKAEVIAEYTDGPAAGTAAIVSRSMGEGKLVVLGTLPESSELQRLIVSLATEAGIVPAAVASSNVLVVPRSGTAGDGFGVAELYNREGKIQLDRPAEDLLTGKRYSGTVTVPPYGVMILVCRDE